MMKKIMDYWFKSIREDKLSLGVYLGLVAGTFASFNIIGGFFVLIFTPLIWSLVNDVAGGKK
jgi:hypothetical protein